MISKVKPVTIRITLSKSSIKKIDSMMNYFYNIGVKNILIAPICKTGRAIDNDLSEINIKEYIEAFEKILDIAREKNMVIYGTCFEYLKSKRVYVCGAMSCKTMTITTEGNLTSCFEVIDEDDPLWSKINIGKVEAGKGVKIYQKKIDILKQRNVENLNKCKNCFAKYSCAGGCGIRSLRSTGSIMGVSQYECEKNKKTLEIVFSRIWENSIFQIVEGGKNANRRIYVKNEDK